MGERRGNWMAVVQEFDLDIKPAKLVKDKGYANWQLKPRTK
jgi:hypothetical protein